MGHYWLNLDYYATELCENIDKPELNCNGNCQVAKELDKSESHSKSPIRPTVIELNIFTLNNTAITVTPCSLVKGILFEPLEEHYMFSTVSDFFHPPEFKGLS